MRKAYIVFGAIYVFVHELLFLHYALWISLYAKKFSAEDPLDTFMGKSYPKVSQEYEKAVEKCKRKLRGFIAEKHCAPLILRLAYAASLSVSLLSQVSSVSEYVVMITQMINHACFVALFLSCGLLDCLSCICLVWLS